MPQIVAPMPYASEPAPTPVRWTRRQCDAMREIGVLSDRYELIEGVVIDKMGQKPPHSLVVVLLNAWLIAIFGPYHVQCQLPIDVADDDNERNEPEPDGAAFNQPITAYPDRYSGPTDLHLVVEVSDTTLNFDLHTKAALYARAGICEYWVIDLDGRQIFVHRRPSPAGYAEIVAYQADEEVAPFVRPDATVRVSDLLPPASI